VTVTCPECGEATFKDLRGLTLHRRARHGITVPKQSEAARRGEPLACPWPGCTYLATDVRDRNQHVLHDCERRIVPKSTVCKWCGEDFDRMNRLGAHERRCRMRPTGAAA
jgi:hypothetical protein